MKHKASIKGVRVVFDNPSAWTVDCAKHEGVSVEIELSKPKRTRTNNQNAYVFGIIVPMLCDAIGYPASEAVECWDAVKIAVGHCKDTKIGKVALTTRNMDTKAFSELIERIRTFASVELNTRIPSPNESDYGL